MEYLLGLDVGTTNCKALAVEVDGRVAANCSATTPVIPSTVSSETAPMYDAGHLWETVAGLIQTTVAQLGPQAHCIGISVASMGESGVLIDHVGKPLVPVLIWHDPRSLPWVQWWKERIPETKLYEITGLPLDYIYSALKIQWSRSVQPEAFTRASKWLCISDWITYCLTGQQAASESIASRTMLFDLRSRNWSQDLLELADIPSSLLPEPCQSGTIVGRVTPSAAGRTGLSAGIPVAAGGHDHICAALAAGVIAPGSVLDSAGTAEAFMITLNQPATHPDLAASGLCCGCHTVRNRYYLLGGLLGCGVINWMARLFFGEDTPEAILRMTEEGSRAQPGAGGTWFQSYLEGTGSPDRDAEAWGAWLGLKLRHGRPELIRAGMEGMCYSFRKLLETLETQAGFVPSELRAVGGGTRIPALQALKANVLGLPLDIPAVTDVTALGAALLAGIGVGAYADEAQASQAAYTTAQRFEVDPQLAAWYEQQYREIYRSLYPALRSIRLDLGPVV